jgi:uncharacterized membrane protein YidH (DUF202 family)
MEIGIDQAEATGKGSWLVRLGRLGYAVKGIVYIVVGFLATKAGMGMSGGETTDSQGAVQAIGSEPLGRVLLVIVAAGLLGYAAWRIVSAVKDAERRGDEPTSIAVRIGEAARGLIYGSLGAWTLRYILTDRTGEGEQTRGLVATALELPSGRWLVVAAGLGVIGYALYQVYRAVSGKFMKRLDFSDAGYKARTWTERFGRFGIIARAVVFAVIGSLVARAGWNYAPSQAGGVERSLDVIAREQSGYVFIAIAIGLIAYGLFEIATARFRVMRTG